MTADTPPTLALIAGKGSYPLELARSARRQGVKRIVTIGFTGETDRAIARHSDELHWIRLGQLGPLLDALARTGSKHAVMAGQITPTSLFRVRPDARMLALLSRLPERNADTIFGAVGDELKKIGIELLPAHRFMEYAMPVPGLLSRRPPTEREQQDIELGVRVAKATSGLNIGQTVVVKEGVILAVEAFEGTNAAIERASRLGGPGGVVVKVARQGHDMRFDIPVVGLHTMKALKKAAASALALEARRTIILDREEVLRAADKINLCITAAEV